MFHVKHQEKPRKGTKNVKNTMFHVKHQGKPRKSTKNVKKASDRSKGIKKALKK